ncbi:MAG: NAD-dependent succinate-semialdehyde dehydrogenase, partial [Phycisphaerae bacterium]|nr:NAD-dependent succinate-semialdehyde dehydrogenase [Phycisphaerae bacterium]
ASASKAETTPMWIGGKPASGRSGKTVEVFNPSTEELVGRVPEANPEDIDEAVRSSHEAFKAWRETPAAERAAVMMKLVSAVRANIDDIGRVLTTEQGKPFPQAKGEINGFCSVIEFYAQEARRIHGMVLQSDLRDKFVYVLRQPMGVIAAIPPWNDPLHLLSRMIGPAFAAGCTAVAKPSSDTPLATLLMAKIATEAGFPAGVLNVVTGPGGRTGDALVRHPLIRKAAITGSVEGGKQVMRAAADAIKRVTLELGGQCPCIVWHDADIDKAVDAITFQAFRGCGQVCNRVNRVYVHEKVYDVVTRRIAELASRIVAGDGFKEGVDIGPLVNKKQLEWVSGQVEKAVAQGAKVLAGGKRIGDKGCFYAPTVLAGCTQDMEVMREETFGPVLAFMKVGDDLGQAFDLANDTVFGLSAYFFSRDARNCYLAAQRMEAGSIWINDIHGSFVQAPYGGMKQSGIGREQGSVAIDDYLEWKTVYQEMSYESRGARLCVHPK